MTALKATGMALAVIVCLISALFGIASSLSLGSSDVSERKDATISAFWSFVTLALCAAAIVSLSGCSTLKYAECIARDNTVHPCQ